MPTLDTSLLIDLIRGNADAFDKIQELENIGEVPATTSINILELYKGAYGSANIEKNLKKLKIILEGLAEIPISDDSYHSFGFVASELKKKGKSIGDFDELIAAITLCNDGVIITRDRHFLHVPGLDVEIY